MRVMLEELLEVTGGRVLGQEPPRNSIWLSSFHTDSRDVVDGGLFFALKGAAMDGHAFVRDAENRGARAAVVDRPVAGAAIPLVQVPDTWSALYELAGWVLRRVTPLVVGVTGSNGKTSTKEMIASLLATRMKVVKNEGNLNTETGLPLTILRLEPFSAALVVEMGIQKPGDMMRLVELAHPRVGVVTNIGTVHVEFFGTVEGIAREKGQLVANLPPDGLAVLPADDRFLPTLRQLAPGWVQTFGFDGGDARVSSYAPTPAGGATFTVNGVPVELGMGGRHQARNAAASLLVAEFAGVPMAEAAPALLDVSIDHRLQRVHTPHGFDVVDDAYNASPESMLAAFDSVAEMPANGPKLALLGEMRELGAMATEAHRRIGARAAEVFDAVCVADVGQGRTLAEAAHGELVQTKDQAVAWVRDHAVPGSLVLVKASHGLALTELVKKLSEPDGAG